MHELSLCLSLLDQLKTIAAERGASRVARIEVTIGPLSGVESDLLMSAWPLAAAGSIATNSEIIVRCGTCGAETPAQANRLVCGQCGDFRTTLVSGDEMTLQRLELEASADPG